MEANIKLRQPLRRVVVLGADKARLHAAEIMDELRVKEISFDTDTTVEVTVKPNFPVAGPRLGPKIKRDILIQYGALLFDSDTERKKALVIYVEAYRGDERRSFKVKLGRQPAVSQD